MSRTILYSLENISSSLKSCKNISIAPDFYNTIYTSGSLHRYSVIYRNKPYYMYVIVVHSDKVDKFITTAQQISLYDNSPFQEIEYFDSELLSFDDNREGRYYDIILSEQCGELDILNSSSPLRLNFEIVISLCNTILWLLHNNKTVTNLTPSQLKIYNNHIKLEINNHNIIESINSDSDYELARKLIATTITILYSIVNNRWSIDIQNIIESGWSSGFNDSFISLIEAIDKTSIKESIKFITGGGSIKDVALEIENLTNLNEPEIEKIFKIESNEIDFYDTRRYTIHPDLSSEMRHAICDKESGKFGFIDLSGRAITEIIYDSVTPFYESIAVVTKNRHYYAINRNGEKLLNGNYSYIKWSRDENVFIVADRKRNYSLLSRQGELLTRSMYAKIEEFFYNRAIIVGFDGGKGFIDPRGREIVAPICEQVLEYDDGVAYAKHNNQWYIVGYDGDMYLKKR